MTDTSTADLKRLVISEFAAGDPVKPVRKTAIKDACRVCTLLDDPPKGEFRRPQAHDKTRLHTDTVKTDKGIMRMVSETRRGNE